MENKEKAELEELALMLKENNSELRTVKLRPYHINQLYDYMLGRETFAMEKARRYNAKFALETLHIFDRLFDNPEIDVEIVPALDSVCEKCNFLEDKCRFFDTKEERSLVDHLGLKAGWIYKAGDITRLIENMQETISESEGYFGVGE